MKTLLNYDFEFVQDINPVLDNYGKINEFFPQERYKNKDNLELNNHGDGAFCKFAIHPRWSGVSGVYAFYIDDTLAYIGQALDLAKRFNMGYGTIAPRNCYVRGQSTNCKINKLVLNSIKANKKVSLYFHMTHNFNEVERELIQHYNPEYNGVLKYDLYAGESNPVSSNLTSARATKVVIPNKNSRNPSIADVRAFIQNEIKMAKENGHSDITIQSGTIHKKLNMINAMPTVCSAMRTLNGNYSYEVIESPPKGNGSRLIFKYIIYSRSF